MLSTLSGYVDTAVFVYMGGLFVAHVTGNFVLLGTTLVGQSLAHEHSAVVTLQLLSFPIFILAAGFAAFLAGRMANAHAGTRALLGVVTLIFAGITSAVFMGFEIKISGAILLVIAMGILNAAQRLDTSLGPPFTVMTGNVTNLAIMLAQRLHLTPADPKKTPLLSAILPVTGFLIGCVGGALMQAHFGLGAMFVPMILIGIALLSV
jgi:uncharacterized membrane protein YoaK (UPF0700 family)